MDMDAPMGVAITDFISLTLKFFSQFLIIPHICGIPGNLRHNAFHICGCLRHITGTSKIVVPADAAFPLILNVIGFFQCDSARFVV